uniref:uncharacterized protein LOC105758111 n=1 Tax=Odobenus rosmarus divergens TaxID=9708 RepID=UPI00063CD9C0|nr:PREDICTED: uncharacterized protein LOC105758111 [Odobenus rosmarus divergens]
MPPTSPAPPRRNNHHHQGRLPLSSFDEYRFHFIHLELLPIIVSPSLKVAQVDRPRRHAQEERQADWFSTAESQRPGQHMGPPAGPPPSSSTHSQCRPDRCQ